MNSAGQMRVALQVDGQHPLIFGQACVVMARYIDRGECMDGVQVQRRVL
jgi:hypothetical protein